MSVEPERENQGEKSMRAMSSFQVFQRFVKVVDGKETGEDILSRNCFDLWLNTRETKIIHPEESFRRTLIAHIRGVYGRKPFSPEVEASLLKLLRDSAHPDLNPWANCFPENSTNIGKRGFNKLGFHEEITMQGSSLQSSSQRDSEGGKSVEQSIQRLSRNDSDYSSYGDIIPAFHNTRIDFSMFPDELGVLDVMKKLSLSDHGDASIFSALLLATVPHHSLPSTYYIAKTKGHDVFSPALMFFLESQQYQFDPRMEDRVLLPAPEERNFFEGRPIGVFVFNSFTWLIEDCDPVAEFIIGGSFRNMHVFDFMESKLQNIIAYNRFFPILLREGVVWIRLRVRRLDNGSIRDLLIKLTRRAERFHCEFQDQSDVHSHLLSVPLLL